SPAPPCRPTCVPGGGSACSGQPRDPGGAPRDALPTVGEEPIVLTRAVTHVVDVVHIRGLQPGTDAGGQVLGRRAPRGGGSQFGDGGTCLLLQGLRDFVAAGADAWADGRMRDLDSYHA